MKLTAMLTVQVDGWQPRATRVAPAVVGRTFPRSSILGSIDAPVTMVPWGAAKKGHGAVFVGREENWSSGSRNDDL